MKKFCCPYFWIRSEPGVLTIWLVGCWGSVWIMASISSNFFRVAWTSEWSSLYSEYWSLNTARYRSFSSLDRIAGYLLHRRGRTVHITAWCCRRHASLWRCCLSLFRLNGKYFYSTEHLNVSYCCFGSNLINFISTFKKSRNTKNVLKFWKQTRCSEQKLTHFKN